MKALNAYIRDIKIDCSANVNKKGGGPYQTFVANCILGGSNGYPSAREKEKNHV